MANRSKRWVQLLRSVAARFPPDVRDEYPELTWQHFRFAASHEDVMPAEDWLRIAQDEHLSTREMAARLNTKTTYRCHGTCEECGSKVSVRGTVPGLRIICPVCAALESDMPGLIGVTE